MMRFTRLEKRITVWILIPMVVGIVLLELLSALYFQSFYISQVDKYRDHIVSTHKTALATITLLLSESISSGVLQPSVNFMVIAGDLIEQNLVNQSLEVKSSFTGEKNYVNSILFDNFTVVPQGFDPLTNNSYQCADWYLNPLDVFPENLPAASQSNLYYSAVYDSFLMSIARLPNINNTLLNGVYLGWNNDGMFYINPTSYLGFDLNPERFKNCEFVKDFPHFDSRCRPWFDQTLNAPDRHAVVLTDPYIYTNDVVGETACKGTWEDNYMIVAVCTDLKLSQIADMLHFKEVHSKEYVYILSTNYQVIYHQGSTNITHSIQYIEFGNDTNEAEKFNKTVLAKFSENTSSISKFTRNGSDFIIAIAPIFVKNDVDDGKFHWASVAVVAKENDIIEKMNSLQSDTKKMFLIEGLVFLAFSLIVIYFFWYLTNALAKSIVAPLDTLNHVLKRLMQQDFAIDITEETSKMSRDLSTLYKVFDKLRVIMKFKDKKYFSNDANALINYSQALKLFDDFGNLAKSKMCMLEIGKIHAKNSRFAEAATFMYNALQIPDDSYADDLSLKVYTAKLLLQESIKVYEAKCMFEEAIFSYSEHKDYVNLAFALIDYASGLISNGEYPLYLLSSAKSLIHKIPSEELQEILLQRILFYTGLINYTRGLKKKAFQMFADAVTDFQYFDLEIRKKSRIFLREVGIDIEEIKESPSDFSFVIQDKYLQLSKIVVARLKDHVDEKDRMAVSTFGKSIKSVQNLTCDFEGNYERNKINDKGRLIDGVFRGIKYLKAQSNYERAQWVIVFTDGNDEKSECGIEKLMKNIEKSNARIVVLMFGEKSSKVVKIMESAQKTVIFDFSEDLKERNIWNEIIAVLLPNRHICKV